MRKFLVLLLMLFALPALAQAVQGTVTTTYNVVAHGTPTTALPTVVTPVFTNGTHYVKVAYVTSAGTSTLSGYGTVQTTDSSHTAVRVTTVASTNPSVTGIAIYGTKAGAASTGPYYYLTTAANASTTVDVGALDAAMTVVAPSSDTSAVDTLINATGTSAQYSFWIHNNDGSLPVYVSFNGTTVDTTAGPFIAAGKDLVNPCYVYLPGGGSIRLRSTTAGVSVSYVLWPK